MPSAGRARPEGILIDGDPTRDGATITVVHLGPDKTTVEIREYYDDALCDEWVCNPEAGIELDRVAWDRLVAQDLGLRIAPPDPKLEALLWSAYLGLEAYMLLRRPFNPLAEFYADPVGAQALAPSAPVAVPPNTPPQVADQVWNAVLSQAIQRAAAAGVEVERETIAAVIESARCASQHRTRRRISAVRLPNGDIKVTMADVSSAWEAVPLPVAVQP